MRKTKWTQKQINEILSRPFHCFPPPKRGKRGPNEAFWPVFINDPTMRKKCRNKGIGFGSHRKLLDLIWGSAGCHGLNTPILMYDGSIKMVQDIEVGDLLMGPDSKPRRVLRLCRGRDQMYKVIPTKGDPFICNADHILSLKTSGYTIPNGKRGGTQVSGTIKNIAIKDFIKLAKCRKHCLKLYKPESIIFNNDNQLPLDPYILGIWLGDGSSKGTEFTNIDKELINAWAEYCRSEFGLDTTKGNGKREITYTSTMHNIGGMKGSNKFLAILQDLNLINNKHIPSIYLKSNKENLLSLLAGLLDTDGSYSSGYYEITQKSKELSEGIVFISRCLGFATQIRKTIKSCTYKGEKRLGTYYRITICGEGLEQIPCKLPRKQASPRQQKKNALVTGFKLEELGEDNYYGFELDGDHLYLLGDFTVTHNSGKTQTAVGLGLSYGINFPGSLGLVGGKVYGDIYDNVILKYKDLLTIENEWDHPFVVRHPTPNGSCKELVLKIPIGENRYAYSTIKFMHFDDWERLRGRSPDWIHFEEMSQMEDVSVIDELDRRCRGTMLPVRHIFCTTNPPEDYSHFIYEKWGVRQFQDGYDGPKLPMGKPCKCQFCQDCLNNDLGEFEFDENDTCTNPSCATIKITGQRGKRDYYKIGDEILCCNGNEEFWRVFLTKMSDNPHLPLDQQQSNKAGTDERTYQLYSEGKILELNTEYCYPKMSYSNIRKNIDLDYSKDVILACDANTKPQCSVIIQEDIEMVNGDLVLKQLNIPDEMVLYVPNWRRPNPLRPGAGPADVAFEFMDRYPDFNKTIWLWGDPNAHGNTQDPFQRSFYQTVYDILTENGYKVQMGIKSMKGNNSHPVIDKVHNTNWLLEDHLGIRRIFINSKCEWLIMALNENKWDPNGKALKDKAKDRLAFKAKTVTKRPLTHITDALDAYIAFKFNIIQENSLTFFQIPGEFATTIENGRVKEHKASKFIKEQLKEKEPSLKDIVQGFIDSYKEEGEYNIFQGYLF